MRKIVPVVPVHNLEYVQGMSPGQKAQGAESAESRLNKAGHQAGPPGYVERAGLKAGVRSSDNVIVSGGQPGVRAGCRIQKEVDSAEAMLRAGSEMANPGILSVLRSVPRAKTRAESVLGSEQSSGRPDQSCSRELDSEGGRPAAAVDTPGRGGSRRLDGQDRSDSSQQLLGSSSPVQGDRVHGDQVRPEQVPVQIAEASPPTVRRGSRIKQPTNFYQAGQSGMV